MKIKKTVYYTDLLNDEFSGTKIKRLPLPENFKFIHTNPLYRLNSFLVYFCIARPLLWLVGKIWMGVKVSGRKNLKAIRHKGAFFYTNHTHIIDAWTIQCYVSKRRTYVFANQDSTSIKGLRWFITLLGCIPVPENKNESVKFQEAVNLRYKQKCCLSIFPEAHIWPYYTRIRPFKDDSFTYPSELGAPVVAVTSTYRRRKIFRNLSPRLTLHVSKPFYPNMNLSLPERKKELRDLCYDFMLTHSSEDENVEYIRYIKKKEDC